MDTAEAASSAECTNRDDLPNDSFQLIRLNSVEKPELNNEQNSESLSPRSEKRNLGLRKKSINFFTSLRNTTLSASRILNFKSATDEGNLVPGSNSNSNKPIDLEAHIIFDDKKKANKIKRKFLKRTKKNIADDSDDEMYPVKVLSQDEINIDDDSDIGEDDDGIIEQEETSGISNVNLEINQSYSFDDYDDDYSEKNYEDDAFADVLESPSKNKYDKTDILDDMHADVKKNSNFEEASPKNNTKLNEIKKKKSTDIEAEQSLLNNKQLPNTTNSQAQTQNSNNQVTCNPIYSHVNYLKFGENDSSSVQSINKNELTRTNSKTRLNVSPIMAPSIIKKSNSTNKLSLGTSLDNRNRQSVSFSEDTFKFKNMNDNNEENKETSIVSSQRINEFEESQGTSDTSARDIEAEYLNQAQMNINTNTNKYLTPYNLNSPVNSSSQLMPNTSFMSNNSNFSAATNRTNSHNVSNRVQKSMTTGSKAMRIMGNNQTLTPAEAVSKGSITSKNSTTSRQTAAQRKLQQRRLFFKNGNINISRSNINKRRRRYLTDIFTTLIDLKWRYNIFLFAIAFLVSWILFAVIWYFISYWNGDLKVPLEEGHVVCVKNLHSFWSALLFSIETQQTIGYGHRFTTEQCFEAIIIMMIQSSFGVVIQSFMVGVVFAKLSRPKKRSETLMFSKNAVISLRDGRLCLICRVGDMRKSHIVEAHVRMYLIKKKVTQEGEILPLHMYDLNVGWDKGADRLFLVWPLTIEHYIDEESPFWNLSADDLKKERFELAVILEGIVESTGMTTQARSSYLCNEILWGHRFEKLITFQKEDGAYKIDYSRFNMTIPIDTPTCSAKDLNDFKEQEQEETISRPLLLRQNFNDNYNTINLRHRRTDVKDDYNEDATTLGSSLNFSDKLDEKRNSINVTDSEFNQTNITIENIPQIVISK